ncbi:MAG: LytTR family DNA-binding domain-containing protein [Megasphaera sp.]|jgi:DNA-binding LytR/AlgR family response regulator|nr:LytTR family DNA-binding domain-containing protein [Megasphaera sp.]MCH4188352.1 LytTR family DNA-binding domain-containing protein [Megasphaera sp.]MCH4218141.1 LytTR family DNA-binding domain-containing protein [Megasphaera sp.]
MGIRVVIVDNEPLMAAQLKESLLQDSFSAEIVSICYEGESAVSVIKEMAPDLVFLTIEMPRMSGIEIATALRKTMPAMPALVFVTGSPEFVVQAVQMDVLDYLIKPVHSEDVRRVFHKFITIFREKKEAEKAVQAVSESAEEQVKRTYSKKFTVDEGDKIRIIDTVRIRMVYAQKRKVFLVTTTGETYQTRVNLTHFEQRLPEDKFFRCHRNYIVNVDEIQQIEPWFNHQYILVLKGEPPAQVPVGRSYINKIREYIEM